MTLTSSHTDYLRREFGKTKLEERRCLCLLDMTAALLNTQRSCLPTQVHKIHQRSSMEKGEENEATPLIQDLLTVDGVWGRKGQCSLRSGPLVGHAPVGGSTSISIRTARFGISKLLIKEGRDVSCGAGLGVVGVQVIEMQSLYSCMKFSEK